MRVILVTIGMLVTVMVLGQTAKDKVILKKFEHGEVYITHDTLIREYSWLVPVEPREENLVFYNQQYSHIVENMESEYLKIIYPPKTDIPVKWTPLYKIDEKYYVYGPSDWISNFGYVFCDSTIIRQYSDGPDVNVIINSRKVSDKKYGFTVLTYDNTVTVITILIIDKVNDVAIWKFESDHTTHYELMVNSNHVKKFPLVKCDCGNMKCFMEYEFQPIDFEKMFKNIH